MNNHIEEKLQQLLRKSIPPVKDQQLERDLWPQMLLRLDERVVQVHWLDWALAAVLIVCLAFYPELIPLLFYHL